MGKNAVFPAVGFIVSVVLISGCSLFFPSSEDIQDHPGEGLYPSLVFGGRSFPAMDYCAPLELGDGFGPGLLISFWTKISYPIVAPDYRGNQNICRIAGENWDLICLDGNLAVLESGNARYNANYMLNYNQGEWAGDVCTFYSSDRDGISMEKANGWVWVAWQVVINPDRSMTLRQWLKFGMEGRVLPAGHWSDDDGEERLAYGSNALDPICPEIPQGWNPGPILNVQIGDDNTWSGSGYDTVEPLTPSDSCISHAKIFARTDRPDLEELDAIARNSAPDPQAWGDWALRWTGGRSDLSDRSGNGRHLTMMPEGILTEGPPGPLFSALSPR